MKNHIKINSVISGIFLLLLAGVAGCDDYERKGVVTPEITINTHSLDLFVGESAQLKAGPSELTFNWTSEDTGVATVDGSGSVTAVSEGNTNIIVTSGKMTTSIPVTTVTRIPLTGFTLSQVDVDLSINMRGMILPVFDPPNANDASAPEWRSLSDEVATVDYKGDITGRGLGKTEVICTINGMEQKVNVNVVYALTKPFKGPHVLSKDAPLLLQFIDFDFGGEGVAYHDNDDGNSGGNNYRADNGDPNGGRVDIGGDLAIGWTNAGEWLIYTIEVHDAGDYDLSLDLAGDGTSNIRFEFDGVNLTGTIPVPRTGGWGTWLWQNVENPITLAEGEYKMRFFLEAAGTNFRTMKFTYRDPNAIDPNVPIVSNEFDLTKHSVETSSNSETFRVMNFSLVKDAEYTLAGDLADAQIVYNLDFFSRTAGNKVKFLGETGDYKLYYSASRKIVIITVQAPDFPGYLVAMSGGVAYPSRVDASSKSSFNENVSSNEVLHYVLFRKIGEETYQATFMFDRDKLGFKPFHASGDGKLISGWGTGGEYKFGDCTLTGDHDIFQSAGEYDDWGAGDDLDSGTVYRLTLTITEAKTSLDYKVEIVDFDGNVIP